MQGPTNFPYIWKPPSNSRRQKQDIKQVSAPTILQRPMTVSVMLCYLLSTCGQIHRFVREEKQEEQCTYNTEIHSCNHCGSGKAINMTYSGCVFVALCIHHAIFMHHIVISGLPETNVLISRFSGGVGGGEFMNTKSVLTFSITFVSNISHSMKNSCIPIFM